jgi:ribosomal 50S subunit-recycling heat shock protein
MSRKEIEARKPVERAPLTSIRLDKFLKISRIIKRRSVANDACSTGHVTINGKEGKPGSDVRVGDVLGIRFGEKHSEYEILSIAEHAAKQDAADLYRALS